MSIFAEKRKGSETGRWVVEVTSEGRRYKGVFSRIQDARKQELLWKNGATESLGPQGNLSKADLSLDDWGSIARENWKGTKDETQSLKRFEETVRLLKKVLRSNGKALSVNLVDLQDLKDFKALVASEKKAKPATVNRYLRCATAALGWAAERGHRGPVPKISNEAETDQPFFVLSDEQERALRASLVASGNHAVLTVMDVQLIAGCRIGELVGCQNTAKLKPAIADSDIDVSDTKGQVAFLTLRNTKNGETRLATVPFQLGMDLRELALKSEIPSYRQVNYALRAARIACGISTYQPTHAHRHTVVTRLVEAGEPSLKVMKYVGHKNLRTTERYFHQSKEAKVDVMETLINRRTA